MPTVRPHRVAALVLPSVVPFDLGVAVQVFGYPRPDLGRLRYTLTVCGAKPGLVPTSGGFSIAVTRGLGALRNAETIVVPGIDDLSLPVPEPVARALQRAHERGVRLVSICTGAFVLAAAGVLDGRRATTHWALCEALQRRFPAVRVERDPIFVRDGNVFTSAGITAGMDLALELVEEDCGRDAALTVARWLVMFLRRPGGQSQFSAQLSAQLAERDGLRDVQGWIADHPESELTVPALARRAHMSPRNFARAFRRETGVTPAAYVEAQRVEAARRLLETTTRSVAEVAAACGFPRVETMHRAFRRVLNVAPAQYRRHFRAKAS
jgi:transcriptional regulator GlxA family with amidase domain